MFFIENDLKMYSSRHDESVSCRALNITEELGMVQHVFCDKTGTLTENSMVFRAASIAGVNYEHRKQAENIRLAKAEAEISNFKKENGKNLENEDEMGEATRKPKGKIFRYFNIY